MKALAAILTFLSSLVLVLPAASAATVSGKAVTTPQLRDGDLLVSSRSGVRFKASSTADTFYLYGGPGSIDGKFQDAIGISDVLGHAPHDILPGKWYGVDRTEPVVDVWQVSTFCAETLDGDDSSGGSGDGPGNLAWWAGRDASQEPGWDTPPGYGNSWVGVLEWRQTVSNPGTTAQTVGLDFAFHHDSEPGYDFFSVEYDSAGVPTTVYIVDGSNAPFAAPGLQYPADVGAKPIVYDAGGYGGPDGDEIVIRLYFTSDSAWSDEDGLFDSTCGGAIVDDITVIYHDGVTPGHVDFSDVDTTNTWAPQAAADFFGDFSQIFPTFHEDLDVCRENTSPMVGFVDDGSCPRNEGNNGGEEPCESTGGSLSGTSHYGVPGGWVVNYTVGLSDGALAIWNEVWSPAIGWDLPGTADDDAAVAGAMLRFSVWQDLPTINGMFWTWNIRSSDDGGLTWTQWGDMFLDPIGSPQWLNITRNVTHLVQASPTHVQVSLGVIDASSIYAFPGTDSRPSPMFDNVALLKYRLRGPTLSTNERDLFMDAFPQSGETDFTTLAGRQNADCRIDIRDIASGMQNVPGDSTIVDVVPMIAGTSVDQVKMRWILDRNPLFDDVRAMPAGASVIAGGAANGWDQWTGDLDPIPVTANGVPVNDGDRYGFDLPDEDFAHPGDVLRYYVWATDDQARMSTLPADVGGFDTGRDANGSLYDPRYTVNFLPSAVDDGPGGVSQPSVLFVHDAGFRGNIVGEVYQAFEQNGWTCGVDWDMFSVWAANSAVSNGIGSAGAHGATSDQLAGYSSIVYNAGLMSFNLLSDGSNVALNDKGDDLGAVSGWFAQDADRFLAHFGDDIASALLNDAPAAGGSYVTSVMGVQLVDNDLRDDIEGQTRPIVRPEFASPWFTAHYVADGGCLYLNQFDNIDAQAGALRTHLFLNPSGGPYGTPGRAASVAYDRMEGLNRKASITFPYGLESVLDVAEPEGDPRSSRARLLAEILQGYFAQPLPGGPPTALPQLGFAGPRNVEGHPNPFNPALTISFELGRKSDTVITAYNLRGQRVATVHRGLLEAGQQRVTWNGRDDLGQTVASGVYVLQVEADGIEQRFKATLLK